MTGHLGVSTCTVSSFGPSTTVHTSLINRMLSTLPQGHRPKTWSVTTSRSEFRIPESHVTPLFMKSGWICSWPRGLETKKSDLHPSPTTPHVSFQHMLPQYTMRDHRHNFTRTASIQSKEGLRQYWSTAGWEW